MKTKKRWPCEPKFRKGDAVYYHHRNGDTYPGIVQKVKNQIVWVAYNGLHGDVLAWILQQNLSFQNRAKKR